jgi:hypothetical protein
MQQSHYQVNGHGCRGWFSKLAPAVHGNCLEAEVQQPRPRENETPGRRKMLTGLNYFLRRATYLWHLRRIATERLTEPLHLNATAALVAAFGTFRAKVAFDLVLRRQFAFSILHAADEARKVGLKRLTLVEFGVANGAGLLNMCSVAERVTKATGIGFDVFGFDGGKGMPPPIDYRDHPELYQEGDFPTDVQKLHAALPPNAKLMIGDVTDSVPTFLEQLTAEAPLGFASLDLDYYSSTKAALDVFKNDPEKYLPLTVVYLDDIIDPTNNPWAGELLAVNEFNAENKSRKITPFNALRHQRFMKNARWIDQIYCLHVHDHPARSPAIRRKTLVIANEYIGIYRGKVDEAIMWQR